MRGGTAERPHITADHYFLQPVSNTFMDAIFLPGCGLSAKGVIHEKFGEEITDFVRFNAPKPKAVDGNNLRGVVLRVDRFGNLITNFSSADLPTLFQEQPAGFKITIGKREISSLRQNYADGAPTDVFAILGSMDIWRSRPSRRGSPGSRVGKGAEVLITLEGAASAATASKAASALLRRRPNVALHFSSPFQEAP